jgi:tRNA-2-methylthio-N6-dimethylallyladenosine synthase
VSEVRDLVARGYKEINLIAQNVNSYKDGEVNFAQLLKSVNSIEGNFWIRFVSSHPKDMSEQLIKTIAECGKCCHHIHLPVQAGDDEVLARMNRKYTVEHYRNLLVLIRSYLPDVSITTDIIVGFPGETDEQFEHTADLAEWAKFDNIYIGKYSQRPYTAAAKFKDDVTRLEKKRREEALMDIMRRTAAENHQKYLGQTTEILVEQFSKGNFFGRTRDNTFVKISNKDIGSDLVGQIVAVRITEARDFGMDGELIA